MFKAISSYYAFSLNLLEKHVLFPFFRDRIGETERHFVPKLDAINRYAADLQAAPEIATLIEALAPHARHVHVVVSVTRSVVSL